MLQQTRVDTAIPYFLRFMQAFPTPEALAQADEQDVLACWQGLGYYRRARMLRQGAVAVCARGAMPTTCEELRGIPGIGAYTAGAIASIAFGEAVPAVDGNLRRVFARWLACKQPVDRPQGSRLIETAAQEAVSAAASQGIAPGIWNQAIMELGATVCKPLSPACEACPVAGMCAARAQGCEAELPLLTPKKPPVAEDWAVAVVRCGNGVWLLKRPDEGLLARMWSFPMLREAGPQALADDLRDAGIDARLIGQLPDAKHVFTHRIWRMQGWFFEAEGDALPQGAWTLADQAALTALPMPTALRVYREEAVRLLAPPAP